MSASENLRSFVLLYIVVIVVPGKKILQSEDWLLRKASATWPQTHMYFKDEAVRGGIGGRQRISYICIRADVLRKTSHFVHFEIGSIVHSFFILFPQCRSSHYVGRRVVDVRCTESLQSYREAVTAFHTLSGGTFETTLSLYASFDRTTKNQGPGIQQ